MLSEKGKGIVPRRNRNAGRLTDCKSCNGPGQLTCRVCKGIGRVPSKTRTTPRPRG